MSEKTTANEKATAKKKATGSVVYCGPTVRGVAKQFTVYSAGLPAALEAYMKEHPAARGLIVPLDKFAQTRENLRKQGTAEAILYAKLKQ